MIQIVGPQLTQWDTGRSVSISDSNATKIHFANQGDSKAVIIDIINGEAKIPDYLLQTGKTLFAYAVLDGVTLESKSFAVRKREKPENYVYEDDQRNYIYELITNAENAAEDANIAAQKANEAAEKALKAAESWVMIGDASGESIAIDDAISQPFAGFRIFGKTTQAGVPTPEAPVDLVSVENPTVSVNEQSMLVPYTLHGIPVTTGGNYTDASGQQWICDEVDFARGVYVKRVGVYEASGLSARNVIINDKGNKWKPYPDICLYDSALNGTMVNAIYSVLNTKFPIVSQKQEDDDSAGTILSVYGHGVYTELRFRLMVSEYETAESAVQAINGTVVCYPLATPIERPLSEEELAAYASLHTYRGNTTVSNDASAYMDVAYAMDAKKYIDRLVGTTGVPLLTSITILASAWKGSDSLYSQVVKIPGVTPYSKVDLLPSVEQLAIFHNKDVAFVTENDNGVVTVYAIGDKPALDYTMQAQITEVVV